MSTEAKVQTESHPQIQVTPEPKIETATVTQAPPPKKSKKGRRIKIAITLLVLIGGLIYALISCTSNAVQGAVVYTENTATYQDLVVKVSDSGTVEPADSYTVTTLVTGEVLTDGFEEGQLVEKDDLLYNIDSGDLDYQIQRAELALQQAQTQYNTVRNTYSPSPSVGGEVQHILVKKGDNIAPGTPVAEVANSDTMTIKVPFHSADVASFYIGQTATLTLEGNMEQLSATISTISGADEIGAGGILVRMVELTISNPGAITETLTATAVIGDISCLMAGTFQNSMTQMVVANNGGTVTSISVSEGDWIEANTPICTLGGTTVESSLKNAKIAVDSAKIGLASTVDMLEKYEITAPIAGTVVDKNIKAGDNVEPTSGPMAVLYDMSYLTFTLHIDELDVSKLKVGQTVEITSNALADQQFTGIVDKISINGTTMDGVTTYPVTVLIEDGGDLLPGMNVSADIMVEKIENVLAVPLSAVARGNTVMVLAENGYDKDGKVDPSKLTTVEVEIGRSNQDYVEILSGLEDGDTVVTANIASNIMEQMMKATMPPQS